MGNSAVGIPGVRIKAESYCFVEALDHIAYYTKVNDFREKASRERRFRSISEASGSLQVLP